MARRREEWQGRNKGSAYIRWYSGDMLSDGFVASLMPAEENCYRRLLDFNARDGFIPDDTARLAMMCKLSVAEFEPIWETIGEKFPTVNNHTEKRSNTRIKFELLYQKSRSVSAKERGKKGGRPLKPSKTSDLGGKLQLSSSLPVAKAKGKLKKAIQIQTQIQEKKSKRDAPTAPPPPSWHAGVTWNKQANKVRVTEESWRDISDQLREIAAADDLPLLSDAEYKLSMNRLNGHLMTNAHKRGKALPTLLANWLETDMRTKALRMVKPQSPAATELATEQAWEAERPDNAAAIAACEKELGPHAGRLTKRERYSFCAEGCGYRERA